MLGHDLTLARACARVRPLCSKPRQRKFRGKTGEHFSLRAQVLEAPAAECRATARAALHCLPADRSRSSTSGNVQRHPDYGRGLAPFGLASRHCRFASTPLRCRRKPGLGRGSPSLSPSPPRTRSWPSSPWSGASAWAPTQRASRGVGVCKKRSTPRARTRPTGTLLAASACSSTHPTPPRPSSGTPPATTSRPGRLARDGHPSGSIASFAATGLLASSCSRGTDEEEPFRADRCRQRRVRRGADLDAAADLASGRFAVVTLAHARARDGQAARRGDRHADRIGVAPEVVALTEAPHI